MLPLRSIGFLICALGGLIGCGPVQSAAPAPRTVLPTARVVLRPPTADAQQPLPTGTSIQATASTIGAPGATPTATDHGADTSQPVAEAQRAGRNCPATQPQATLPAALTRLGPSANIAQKGGDPARGEPLFITGTVYDRNCTPVAGASLLVWQANLEGEYGPGKECCYLQATLKTDAEGRYAFMTVKPGHHKGKNPLPPAHIHVNVTTPDGRLVKTELLFADDPHPPADAKVDMTVVAALTAESGPEGEYLRGIFDIVLPQG